MSELRLRGGFGGELALHQLQRGVEGLCPADVHIDDVLSAYDERRKHAVLVPFFKRAIEGLVDRVFRRNIELEDAWNYDAEQNERLREFVEDVDGLGNSLSVFARRCCSDSAGEGMQPFAVLFPETDGQERTVEQARREGLAPFFEPRTP